MQYFKLAIATLMFVVLSGVASAADWTTTEDGSKVCSKISKDEVCWLKEIAEDSSAVLLNNCKTWTVMVFGTGADIMPQTCTNSACSKAENLLATALTGDSPNTFVTSVVPFVFLRIDWTAGGAAPTISLKCGA